MTKNGVIQQPQRRGRDKLSAIRYPLSARILFFLIFAFYALSYSCYAAPSYGTKMPLEKQFFAGFQQHSIFKRYLEHEAGKMRSFQELVLVSYGVSDWFSIDLKGAFGNIEQQSDNGDKLKYQAFLGGGYGFRFKFYDKEKVKMVFGFQHISIHPDSKFRDNVKHKGVLDDWQFCALASRDFKKFVPYLGARWSRCDYIHWEDKERDRIKSDETKCVGLILGLDIPLAEKLWINLEGSVFDNEAAAVSLNFVF